MDFGIVPTVWYLLFYFSNGSRNCSDSVVFFVLFFYWILDLFRRCSIFCFVFLMGLGTVPTVWYFLFYFSIGFLNCSDGAVFFVYFPIGSRNSSDGAVFYVLFFYWILELFRQCGIFCLFFYWI